MIEYKFEDQCNALFYSKNKLKSTGQRLQVLEIHFAMTKKKGGNGAYGTIKIKMAILLAHGKQTNKLIDSRKEKNY